MITVGFETENDFRRLKVADVGDWMAAHPGYAIEMRYVRPGETEYYIPGGVEIEDGFVWWTPDAVDTAIRGWAAAQLWARNGSSIGALGKSMNVHVTAAITEAGEIPEKLQPYVEQVLDAAATIRVYADEAKEAAKSIKELTAEAMTLEPGSDATAEYNAETGVLTIGIPSATQGGGGTTVVVGKSPYIGENGNWFVYDDEAGDYVDSGNLAKGETPIKGVDYFDGEDGKDGKDGRDGRDGVDGKTPVKGVDYFDGVNGKDGKDGRDGRDGVDGKTPVKGVDYFDGVDGKDGKDGKDADPAEIKTAVDEYIEEHPIVQPVFASDALFRYVVFGEGEDKSPVWDLTRGADGMSSDDDSAGVFVLTGANVPVWKSYGVECSYSRAKSALDLELSFIGDGDWTLEVWTANSRMTSETMQKYDVPLALMADGARVLEFASSLSTEVSASGIPLHRFYTVSSLTSSYESGYGTEDRLFRVTYDAKAGEYDLGIYKLNADGTPSVRALNVRFALPRATHIRLLNSAAMDRGCVIPVAKAALYYKGIPKE